MAHRPGHKSFPLHRRPVIVQVSPALRAALARRRQEREEIMREVRRAVEADIAACSAGQSVDSCERLAIMKIMQHALENETIFDELL